MESNREIWIVNDSEIDKKSLCNVSLKEIGQKALGLCHVPEAWTLPFFVVDRKLFREINADPGNYEKIISKYMNNILSSLEELELGSDIIIRSSGEKEGMEERGKYDSIIATRYNLKEKIFELIHNLRSYSELKEYGMPLIIQKYICSDRCGHISNERRFSKERRDFKYEIQVNGKFIYNKKIHLRNKYDIDNYINKNLKFTKEYREILKIVCAYYSEKKERVHLEFVNFNNTIFIVQKDNEVESKDSYDPTAYDIEMNKGRRSEFNPKVLRKITKSDKGEFKKIENVFIYEEVGIELPPLYILDEKSHIINLEAEKIDNQLRNDLCYLSKKSLVIRTNINSTDKKESQLSRRSNEIRSFDEAKKFLIDTSKDFKKNGIFDYIYIFHNFIPAKIAAFVNAKPLERIVEIQALWGLPEGLYYNAHDSITIDTMRIDALSMEKQKFKITKEESFKENFIIPDENGNWVLKKIKAPFDWEPTIKNDEIIRDMAYKARKITENVGKELSIMWFVDIDEEFYGMNNMPWHHEEFDRNYHYYESGEKNMAVYKKKYFSQVEFIIENNDDVEKLRSISPGEVGIVKLKPKEDELLRSKSFITTIGKICKSKNISILLEGSILAHSYYQLINTEATVLISTLIKQYDEKIEFNKLVRDKIPGIIRENGEYIKYVKVEGIGLITELKYKLIEEAYELLAAKNNTEILEELADLLEVCDSIKSNFILICEYKSNEKKSNSSGRVYKLEFTGLMLEHTIYTRSINDNLLKYATVKKVNNKFQLDLLFIKEDNKTYDIDSEIVEGKHNEYMVKIMKQVFETLKIQNDKEFLNALKFIEEYCHGLCRTIDSNISDLIKIRELKKEEKGGFSRGFVLVETSLNSNIENLLIKKDEIVYTPKNVYGIERKYIKEIDTIGEEKLIVRVTFPCDYQNVVHLKEKKIYRFLGKNSEISITKSFEDTKLCFNVEIFENEYEQLILEGLKDK